MPLLEIRPCRHERQGPTRWTQDGWVSKCLDCSAWIYHGDAEYPADNTMPETTQSGCCLGVILIAISALAVVGFFHLLGVM